MYECKISVVCRNSGQYFILVTRLGFILQAANTLWAATLSEIQQTGNQCVYLLNEKTQPVMYLNGTGPSTQQGCQGGRIWQNNSGLSTKKAATLRCCDVQSNTMQEHVRSYSVIRPSLSVICLVIVTTKVHLTTFWMMMPNSVKNGFWSEENLGYSLLFNFELNEVSSI